MKTGARFRHGNYCVFDEDVIVGENVKIGHYVHLKNGTVIGDNVVIADYCCTTGLCYIGDDVNIRTGSIISKGVIIEECSFLGAGVITSHTKKITHCRSYENPKQFVTRIGYGSVIGSGCVLSAGVEISPGSVVGYGSIITSILKDSGIYYGNPLRYQGEQKRLVKPVNWKPYNFTEAQLEKYLPYV